MPKTSTLEVLTATTADLGAIATAINATHASAKSHAQLAVVFAMRTGALCERAKEAVGHGPFGEWLATNCPQISDRTARKYMALLRESSKSEAGSDLPLLELTSPDFVAKIDSDAAYRDEMTTSVRAVVGEGSLNDLYKEFDIIRAPANIDVETGKRKHYPEKPKPKKSREQVEAENRAAARKMFLNAFAAVKAATNNKQARRFLRPKDWVFITKTAADHITALNKIAAQAQVALAKGGKTS